jgi:heme-degrading monooxygenase HmoA
MADHAYRSSVRQLSENGELSGLSATVASQRPTWRKDTEKVIVRAWHATATAEGADAYREHFTRAVLPELQRIDGYQGAYLLRRDHDTHVRLQVLTLWDSLEAISSFAGANPENAVVEPAVHAALVSYDSTVTHHTVVVNTVGANARIGE